MPTPSWRVWLARFRAQVRPPRRRSVRPAVEEFESRLVPSLTVNASGDDNDGGTPMNPYGKDGTLSLREAIELIDAGYNNETTIDFSVSTVSPTSALPAITVGGVTINGSGVTIDGSQAGGAGGLDFQGAGNKVTGLTINNFGGVQLLFEAGGNTIQGCFVGTNMGGTAAVGGFDGVVIQGDNNLVGGPSNGNVISANSDANLVILGNGSTIQGNFLGTDKGGKSALGGGVGLFIQGGNNTVGGTDSSDANVISGNQGQPAVAIHSQTATANLFEGNFVGTDITGKKALGNAGTGISIGFGATNNTVGGTTSAARNIISDNGIDGVAIGGQGTDQNLIVGNYIGTDATGAKTQGFGNKLDGVDIYGGASSNTIGGTTSAAANVIAGSAFDGVSIYDVDSNVTSNNVVAGNFIGTDLHGSKALANQGNGVSILDGAADNTIGGTTTGAINVISGNGADGVFLGGSASPTTDNVVEGNRIGTDLQGTMPLPNSVNGVEVKDGATGNTVGGEMAVSVTGNVISANGNDGVLLSGSNTSGNVVEGNLVGTDINGAVALPNSVNGVELSGGASSNTIGGTLGVSVVGNGVLLGNGQAGNGNIISGNGHDGVLITGSDTRSNVVEGNYVGTDINGSVALANDQYGVEVTGGAADNTVGGSLGDTITGNVISGNSQGGVVLSASNTTDNVVSGNYIGTDPNDAVYASVGLGTSPDTGGAAWGSVGLGNGDAGAGVLVTDDSSNNTIGGTAAGAGNIIAFNKHNGVNVQSGTGNAIREDLFFDNGGSDQARPPGAPQGPFLPIALGGNLTELNPNTPAGQAQGANNLENYPIITLSSEAGGRLIEGTLHGTPGTTYSVDIYVDLLDTAGTPGAEALGQAGTQLLDAQQVATDGNGNALLTAFFAPNPITIVPPAGGRLDLTITGTATDEHGNTSEFGVALTPAQIRTAYGVNNLGLDGSGQTIAIVVAHDDPNIFVDLDRFDHQFGATLTGPSLFDQYGAAASFLTVFNQGAAPDPSGSWEGEEMLDVEWAHAMAPRAKIDVVEVSTDSGPALLGGVVTANGLAGVSVVSMSWGAFGPGGDSEDPSEVNLDHADFSTPGITYIGASGDHGAGNFGYPPASPNVVGVGGTTFDVTADGSYGNESGWRGSGGGVSQFEHEPTYQHVVQNTGQRTVPDVALIGGTQVAVAESYNPHAGDPGWRGTTGTSLSAPCWAGLMALVNQGREAAGKPLLNSPDPQETLRALYSMPAGDFHDIVTGSNGFAAGPGYDLVTGLGTPRADLLIPDLINYMGVSLKPRSLPAGTVGMSYNQTITASGGNNHITVSYAVTSGHIPAGLNFAVNGNALSITGKPTASGSVTFTVAATDTVGSTAQQSYTLTINPSNQQQPITLTPSSLPPGTVGTRYNQAVVGSGGNGQVTVKYNITLGSIPTGLKFQVNNNNELDITGTPTAAGSVTFTVTATDTAGDTPAQQSYTVIINSSGKLLTQTSLTATATSVVYGQAVTFTATVSGPPLSGTPTGTVTFLDGGTPLATVPLSGGKASFTAVLGAGQHQLTAVYSGDSTFAGSSSSPPLGVIVKQATTTTAFRASPTTVAAGKPVTLTAAVSVVAPGAGLPTGTITFYDGGTALAVVPVTGAGQVVSVTVTLRGAGAHTLYAVYSGDANFKGSTSPSQKVAVGPGPGSAGGAALVAVAPAGSGSAAPAPGPAPAAPGPQGAPPVVAAGPAVLAGLGPPRAADEPLADLPPEGTAAPVDTASGEAGPLDEGPRRPPEW